MTLEGTLIFGISLQEYTMVVNGVKRTGRFIFTVITVSATTVSSETKERKLRNLF